MTYDYHQNGNLHPESDVGSDASDLHAANAQSAAPESVSEPSQPAHPNVSASTAYASVENDPWREPVYQTADDPVDVYSPGHHSCGHRAQGTYFPVLDNQKKQHSAGKRHHGFLRAACIVLACVLLSSAACAGITTAITDRKLKDANTNSSSGDTPVVVLGSDPSSSVSSADNEDSSTGALTAAEVYALGCRQVVGIQTEFTTTNVFGQATNSAVSGSGFVISEDGYILTNYHVIEYAGGESSLTVMFYGNAQTYDADVIAYDADNDVAVVKINASGLEPVEFGDDLSVGETIYCIGNPLGELDYTMTSGIISALDREITTEAGVSINMFQIDAAVNSGNSGGPVYNDQGQVVGIVTAKYSNTGVEGLGFAIPIQDAVNIATDLIQYGYVAGKAYLGINGETVSSSAFQYYNLPYGVYVTNVLEETCASRAGVKIGDIITAIDDTEITSYSDLKNALRDSSAGDTIELTVYRSGEYLTLSGTLDERPPAGPISSENENSSESSTDENAPKQNQGLFPWVN